MLYPLRLPLLPLRVKQREIKRFVDLPVDSVSNLLSTFFRRRSEEVGLHAPQLKVRSPVYVVQPFQDGHDVFLGTVLEEDQGLFVHELAESVQR